MVFGSILVWLFIFAVSYLLFNSADHAPDTTINCTEKTVCTPEAPCCLGNVRVYSQANKGYGELKREEALKFGLEKIDTTINYLFIAIAGILALLGKIIIDPLTKKEETQYLTPFFLWLTAHCAVLCILSAIVGFVGRLYLTSIGDVKGFSIYGELGIGMLIQFFLFIMASIFLGITIVVVVFEKKKNGV